MMKHVLRLSCCTALLLAYSAGATQHPLKFRLAEEAPSSPTQHAYVVVIPKYTAVNDQLRQDFEDTNGLVHSIQDFESQKTARAGWADWVQGPHAAVAEMINGTKPFELDLVDAWRQGIRNLLSEQGSSARQSPTPVEAKLEALKVDDIPAAAQAMKAEAVEEEPTSFSDALRRLGERLRERVPVETQRLWNQAEDADVDGAVWKGIERVEDATARGVESVKRGATKAVNWLSGLGKKKH